MERHWEGTSSCPISSSCSQGVQTLVPSCKPYRQRRPKASDQLRITGSTLDSDCTDCLNLTAWFSYYVVSFRLHTSSTGLTRCTALPLFINHNVTVCQTHGLTWNEPKIHVNSHYIILWPNPFIPELTTRSCRVSVSRWQYLLVRVEFIVCRLKCPKMGIAGRMKHFCDSHVWV